MSDTYLTITEPLNLRWDGADRIIVTTHAADRSRFSDANGNRRGLQIVWSANPMSADYHPANYNRAARALRAAGVPAPDEVPERSRRLRDRVDSSWSLRPAYR